MLTVFFYWEGVVHHEYVPPGQTINKEFNLSVPHRFRDAIQQKQLQLWATGDWQLHRDNAPTHASGLVQSFSETSNRSGETVPLAQVWCPETSGFSQN